MLAQAGAHILSRHGPGFMGPLFPHDADRRNFPTRSTDANVFSRTDGRQFFLRADGCQISPPRLTGTKFFCMRLTRAILTRYTRWQLTTRI